MENKLKVGQRLTVFAVKKDIPLYGIKKGQQFFGMEPYPYLFNVSYDPSEEEFYMYPLKGEVKPIGCFVVREVYTNNNPETII